MPCLPDFFGYLLGSKGRRFGGNCLREGVEGASIAGDKMIDDKKYHSHQRHTLEEKRQSSSHHVGGIIHDD